MQIFDQGTAIRWVVIHCLHIRRRVTKLCFWVQQPWTRKKQTRSFICLPVQFGVLKRSLSLTGVHVEFGSTCRGWDSQRRNRPKLYFARLTRSNEHRRCITCKGYSTHNIWRIFDSSDLIIRVFRFFFLQRIRSSEVSVGHSYNLIESRTRRIVNVETASRNRVSVHEIGPTPYFHANMYLHLQVNQVMTIITSSGLK